MLILTKRGLFTKTCGVLSNLINSYQSKSSSFIIFFKYQFVISLFLIKCFATCYGPSTLASKDYIRHHKFWNLLCFILLFISFISSQLYLTFLFQTSFDFITTLFHSMLAAYAILVSTLYGNCETRLHGFWQHYMAGWKFYLLK